MIDFIVSHACFLMHKTVDFSTLKIVSKILPKVAQLDCQIQLCVYDFQRELSEWIVSFFNVFQKCIMQKKIVVFGFIVLPCLKFNFRNWDGSLKASDSKEICFYCMQYTRSKILCIAQKSLLFTCSDSCDIYALPIAISELNRKGYAYFKNYLEEQFQTGCILINCVVLKTTASLCRLM